MREQSGCRPWDGRAEALAPGAPSRPAASRGLVLPALPQVPAGRAGSAQPGAQGLLRAGGAAPSQRGGLAGAGSAGAVHRLPARAVGLPQT